MIERRVLFGGGGEGSTVLIDEWSSYNQLTAIAGNINLVDILLTPPPEHIPKVLRVCGAAASG